MPFQASKSLLEETVRTGTWYTIILEPDPIYFGFLPNRTRLGDEKGNDKCNNSGEKEGTWEAAEIRHPEGG